MKQIRDDVETLATREGRLVGTLGHDKARRHICERLSTLGLQPYAGQTFELPYQIHGGGFTNIIARLPGAPAVASQPPVLLAAHYDTCRALPGADDNAAAVAALLAAAEKLAAEPALPCDLIFAFFDAEEPPHFQELSMGSTYFYHHQRQEPIRCAVVMDLVGHELGIPGLEDGLAVLGMESDPGLEAVVRDTAPHTSLQLLPTLNSYVGEDLSDHHVFNENSRPFLFLTCGQWAHYHQPSDTPDKLSYHKLEAVARYLCELAKRLSSSTLTGPFKGYDTTQTELDLLNQNVPEGLLRQLGAFPLASRADIDTLVMALVHQGGLLSHGGAVP